MAAIKTVPAIRFKGFEEGWKEKKLGEIGETFTGLSGKTKNDFGHGEGRFVTYMNVFSNPISNLKQIEPIEIDNSQNSIKYGDVFFTTSSETPQEVGMSSVWLGTDENVYLNSFCFGYRPISKLDSYYLAYSLRSPSFRRKVTFLGQGISRYNISKNKVSEIYISKPSIQEQSQVGNYFKELDVLIQLQEQKLEKIKNLKKAMLEKMFPKKNADMPELRFKGFTGKWGNNKLEVLFGKIRNAFVGTATPYYVKKGHFYLESNNIKNGQINRKSEIFINDYFYEKQKDSWLRTGDIVMVQSGHVGHSAVIPEELNNSAAHALIMFSNPKRKFNSHFINYQFQTSNNKKNIDEITTGNTIKHILSSEMKEFEVMLPEIAEQDKIAAYLQKLDYLISQSQKKIAQLTHLKQALLQKMFI